MAVLLALALAPFAWSAQAAPPPLKMTDRCVTKADRSRVVRFPAFDGTQLIGLQLGSGPRGVVLSHGHRSSVCEWLPQARRLARAGYRVLVFDHRNAGSSSCARKRYKRLEVVAGTAHGSGLLGEPSTRALFDEFVRTHSN
jgi:pimeloyl-ACP methyl ester carboxylesterase